MDPHATTPIITLTMNIATGVSMVHGVRGAVELLAACNTGHARVVLAEGTYIGGAHRHAMVGDASIHQPRLISILNLRAKRGARVVVEHGQHHYHTARTTPMVTGTVT